MQRDEKVLMAYDMALYVPDLSEYFNKLLCTKLFNKIIDKAIEEDSL